MLEGNNAGNIYVIRRSRVFYLIAGWISAVLSLFMLPFIFGTAGVVLGILSSKGGSRAGLALIIGSMALMAAGLLFNGGLHNIVIGLIGI